MLPFKKAWIVFNYEDGRGEVQKRFIEIYYHQVAHECYLVFYCDLLDQEDEITDLFCATTPDTSCRFFHTDDIYGYFRSSVGRYATEFFYHTKELAIMRFLSLPNP